MKKEDLNSELKCTLALMHDDYHDDKLFEKHVSNALRFVKNGADISTKNDYNETVSRLVIQKFLDSNPFDVVKSRSILHPYSQRNKYMAVLVKLIDNGCLEKDQETFSNFEDYMKNADKPTYNEIKLSELIHSKTKQRAKTKDASK